MRRTNDDRGSIAPLLCLVAVAAGLGCMGLGRLAAAAVDRAMARTAADAAALAGGAGDERDARRFAELNEGRLVKFESAGSEVRAHVAVRSSRSVAARARADSGRDHPDIPGKSRPNDSGLEGLCRLLSVIDRVHAEVCARRLPAEAHG